jgi:hypothetical protein
MGYGSGTGRLNSGTVTVKEFEYHPNKLYEKSLLKEEKISVVEHYGGSELKIIEVPNTKIFKQSKDFSEGRIIYKIPETMKVRNTYRVVVRICKSRFTVSLYDSLHGTVKASNIPVTENMEVKLIDCSPSDHKMFDIIPDDESVQIVESGDTYTQWTFNVTPLHIGNTGLKVVVSVIRNNNKKDVVYEDTVKIEADWYEQIKFFVEEYWKWLISTFIIPVFLWLYKRRKKGKEKVSEELVESENDNEDENGES